MSVDLFQERIRKTKNPSVLVIEAFPQWIAPQVLSNAENVSSAVGQYYEALLAALKGVIPAVRFGFDSFALLGADGLNALSSLLKLAKELGFYVLLDAPQMLSVAAAENAASVFGQADGAYPCDGLILPGYLGSDILKPFLPLAKKGKSLFPVVRTANKSASELQDLLTGARLVHTAAADIINRYGEQSPAKCGYWQVGILASASAADSLRSMRPKYNRLFLLMDGFDYPNANAKNCSYAFDKLGHGAAACAGSSIAAAWKDAASPDQDYLELAVQAAERMKKNLNRYITLL